MSQLARSGIDVSHSQDKPEILQVKTQEKTDKRSSTRSYRIAEEILLNLFANRRLIPTESNDFNVDEAELSGHIEKVQNFVENNQKIEFILPGFPAKSPNRNKTLGPYPDLADTHAIDNLRNFCVRISRIYPPGANIKICSDGRVFSDVVNIREEDVSEYGRHIRDYALNHHSDYFTFFDLDDVYTKIKRFDVMREELLIQFGESLQNLRERCKAEAQANEMYKGITRFLLEDYSGLEEFRQHSKSEIQRYARIQAYRVIQRSNAWTRLIAQEFPRAVRLSIHPQHRVSDKIGVFLVDTPDVWQTPWHSVAVVKGGRIQLMKRFEAEQIALLAFKEGRPSHFEVRD